MQTQDLVGTYIRLTKDAAVYETPETAETTKKVWFYKKKTEVAGKLFSWVDTSPQTGKKYKSVYLMFKTGDNFATGVKPYFIRLDTKMIDWTFTKQELIKKNQSDMNFFEKFIDDVENTALDYAEDLKDYAVSGLKWGVILGSVVLFFGTIVIPYAKFAFLKKELKEVIKTAKNT